MKKQKMKPRWISFEVFNLPPMSEMGIGLNREERNISISISGDRDVADSNSGPRYFYWDKEMKWFEMRAAMDGNCGGYIP